jgi:hypothetical protein
MSTWRRKALALFPELKDELSASDYSIYQLYFDILPMEQTAHEQDDREALRRIYGFAEWCLSQREQELWNPAAVAFYEHLFDEPRLWSKVIPWLSPNVIKMVQGLLEERLDGDKYKKLLKAIESSVDKTKERNIFSTGEIESL